MIDSTKLNIYYSPLFGLVIILFLSSCLKGPQYSDEPVIEFLEMTFTDSIDQLGNPTYNGLITFGFTDGDGDIGVNTGDTTINMFIFQIDIVNGENQPPIDWSYTLPYVTPDGQNKSLKGEIDVELFFWSNQIADSAMFEIYIEDRSKNQSNIITTPIIVLSDL